MKSENPFAKTVQTLSKENIHKFNEKRFANDPNYESKAFNKTTWYDK